MHGLSRSSGILLHPTSLPGSFAIGDLGDEARAFVDFIAVGGQSLWQILPLGPTGFGNSPYHALSAFAGNTLLISPELLVADGLLTAEDIETPPAVLAERVDYPIAQAFKDHMLRKAFANFQRTAPSDLVQAFEEFWERSSSWLNDYAQFQALKNAHGGVEWTKWSGEPSRNELRTEVTAQKFFQFMFFKQWEALRDYCHARGVKIIGDLPIFVAHDSADVWAHREYFKLDHEGQPAVVAGVPPDYFSKTGQLWGNPLYDWDHLRADGFRWWIDRVRLTLQLFDFVRIDHFRGFAACWEIPAGEKTAERGEWVATPGQELFTALTNALGDLPIIAENLGVITPDVESLRQDFRFPGMRVLQFAFGSDSANEHLPHNYMRDVVVYTGTHDNDTTAGWFASLGESETNHKERDFCQKYLNSDGREIHWDFIRAALASVADTAIIPLQDVLGLGSEARMNLPASVSGNWLWRYQSGALDDKITRRLDEMTETYGRAKNRRAEHSFPPGRV